MKYKKITNALIIIFTVGLFNIGFSKDVQWGYIGAESPEHWGEISSDFK